MQRRSMLLFIRNPSIESGIPSIIRDGISYDQQVRNHETTDGGQGRAEGNGILIEPDPFCTIIMVI